MAQKFPSKPRRSISQADQRALARLRLRDAADGFCGREHARRMAELAGIPGPEIAALLEGQEYDASQIDTLFRETSNDPTIHRDRNDSHD